TRPIPSETIPSELAENAFSGPAPAGSGIPSPPNPAMTGGYRPVPPGYGSMPPQSMVMQGNPMPQHFMPATSYNYQMPPPSPPSMGTPATGYAQPASTTPAVGQMLHMLRESDFPSQREWAAEQLAGMSNRSNPEVVQCLVLAAKSDPAPMVRV